ncbi:MAG TPA: glycine zipper family protein, partial [Methylomirabilota bacterium]|nr:glycine zipper family protein [Methylomirabilota bacterium]
MKKALLLGLLLAGCTTVPSGPSVMVLPGTGKTFEQFQGDDLVCRQWAAQMTGSTPGQASGASTAGGAAVGAVVGAAAGAALGAATGSPATGAAVGAGVGLLG